MNYKALIILLLALGSMQTKASHWAGGHITYRYIGDSTNVPGQYLVEVTTYTDRGGINPGSGAGMLSITGCSGSISNAIPLNPILAPPSIGTSSNPYAMLVDTLLRCSDTNDYYEAYKSYAVVTLPQNCPDYLFEINFSGGSARFTNATINSFYLQAQLNNTLGNNNLPKPLDAYFLGSYCENASIIMGDYTVDNDNQYSVVMPSLPYLLPYDSGYTQFNPLPTSMLGGGYSVDTLTGSVSFTPTAKGRYLLAYKYSEYAFDSITLSLKEIGSYIYEVPIAVNSFCDSIVSLGPELNFVNNQKNTTDSCGLQHSLIQSNLLINPNSVDTNGTDFSVFSFRRQAPEPVRSVKVVDPSTLKINYFFPLSANDTIRIISKIGADGNRVVNACGFDQAQGDTLYQVVNGCGLNVEEQEALKVSVYPNPSSGVIHLDLPKNQVVREIQLFNQYGALVHLANTPTKKIDLNHLPNGQYILKYKLSNNLIYQHKIILIGDD